MEQNEKPQDYELELALREARADYAEGRTVSESVDEHVNRVAPEKNEC